MDSADLRFSFVKTTPIFWCIDENSVFFFFKEPIDGHTRTQILSELKDLRNVSDLLSILEMAVGFLSMAGGDPETKICDYLRNVLRLGDGKSNLKSKKVGNISFSYVFLEGTVMNPAI